MRVVIRNANIVDCVAGEIVPDSSVTIVDGRIADISRGGGFSETDAGTEVIDLDGAYLMPGLWDVHIHPEYPPASGSTIAEQTADFGYNLSRALTEAGVIGVRCGGASNFMDVAWREAFESGKYVGPRVFACGSFLTTTGGHFLTSGQARECDGPYGFVQAIREQIKNRVDHIKLNLTGGIMGPFWDRHWHSFMLDDELNAAFDICRQRGYKVMAHAANPDAVKSAVRLGAHTIEHGYIMDDECIRMLKDGPTWYVPTLAISHLTPSQASNEHELRWVEERGIAPDLLARADEAADEHKKWFLEALNSGVKMAIGSDIRPLRDAALLEMGCWARNGATPQQILLAATKNAAELCGVGDDLGTIEVGKLADMIAVAENPLDDVANVRKLRLVFKEGRVVSDKR